MQLPANRIEDRARVLETQDIMASTPASFQCCTVLWPRTR